MVVRTPHFLQVRAAVRAHPDSRLVLGLSGGPDSVALLAAACAEGRDVEAVCVDHQLQAASAQVAEAAAQVARSLGATAQVVRVDVPPSGSVEAQARQARYRALVAVADVDDRPVWVGHTMDDQAETVLLGALRGHVTGMLPRSVQEGVTVVRPLLQVRRADTVGACAELGLRVWEDPHNEDPRFRRVAVRTQVMPQLAQLVGGDVVPGLAQAGERAAWEADLVRLGVDKHREAHGFGAQLAVAAVPQHPALRRAVVAEFIRANGGRESAATIAAVEKMIVDWHGQGAAAIGGAPGGRRLVVARKNGILAVSVR